MLTTDINIRDPFVFPWEDTYYMVGTRAATCWTLADGFDGYASKDLVHWDGPVSLFDKPADFWADKNFWAPEIHFYQGSFYLFATFGSSKTNRKGTSILRADAPLGPYRLHSYGQITPQEWNCLDGTFYLSPDGMPYMVFSHEWQDIRDGQICSVPLTKDLTAPAGEIRTLFSASMARPWVRPIAHPRYPGDNFVTDGPFLYRLPDGALIMLWSTWGDGGYAEAVARSDNGDVTGRWSIDEKPLFAENGGHGMLFRTFEGRLTLTLHQPNTTLLERPHFFDVTDKL